MIIRSTLNPDDMTGLQGAFLLRISSMILKLKIYNDLQLKE
jgi:hypothetical protein